MFSYRNLNKLAVGFRFYSIKRHQVTKVDFVTYGIPVQQQQQPFVLAKLRCESSRLVVEINV